MMEREPSSSPKEAKVAQGRPPSFHEGPVLSLVLLVLLVVLAAVLGGVGFSRPLQRVAPLSGAYTESGHFSYGAKLKVQTPLYPSGKVGVGQPLYLGVIRSIWVDFGFQFRSPAAHDVHGTIGLRALLLSTTDSWHKLTTLVAPRRFTGDRAKVTTPVTPQQLLTEISVLSAQSGASGASYSADIQPVVRLTGTVDGHRFHSTFFPVLPVNISSHEISLDVTASPAPAGATYTLPSQNAIVSSTLNPVHLGAVPHLVASDVTVARYPVPVIWLRVGSVVLAALASLVLGSHEVVRRRRTRPTDEELLAKRLHVLMVPVSQLGASDVLEVVDFANLARLAQYLERPVLHVARGGEHFYAVDDDAIRYGYRPALGPSSPEAGQRRPRDSASTGTTTRRATSRHRFGIIRGAAVILVLLIAATLTVTFTASNTVPTSHAGTSRNALQVAQLAPSGCAGLALTSLVTGAGTFSNGASGALVLGSAGPDTISSTGGYDCIVGGGGHDVITGPSSDVCVTGAALQTAGPCASPSNGVSTTPKSTVLKGGKAQDQLSITSTGTLTAITVTIRVAVTTPKVSYSSESNTFPKGSVTQSDATAGGFVTYSWTLSTGHTIPAGTHLADAIFKQAATRPASGDTWTVTSTSNGIASTLKGTF